MNPFELIKIMMESSSEYENVSKGDKRKNFFIIQRRMAIQYPMQAQVFNGLKINQEQAVDVWARFLNKKYNKTPFWMYTKGVKAAKEAKEKKINIPTSLIEEYAKRYKLDLKSVHDALEFFPQEMKKEIKDFEKLLK